MYVSDVVVKQFTFAISSPDELVVNQIDMAKRAESPICDLFALIMASP